VKEFLLSVKDNITLGTGEVITVLVEFSTIGPYIKKLGMQTRFKTKNDVIYVRQESDMGSNPPNLKLDARFAVSAP
jgi:hypothetical protein